MTFHDQFKTIMVSNGATSKPTLTGTEQTASQVQIAFDKSSSDGINPVPNYQLSTFNQ